MYFFIKKTFLNEQKDIVDLDLNKDKIFEEIKTNKNQNNIIKNLNYISIDAKGNKYILNAASGEEVSDEEASGEEKIKNSKIILLKQVVGIIKLKNKSDIEIKSDFAKYNSITFDTNFYENVLGFFEESKISSDNLDLFFKNNKAIMYNNIQYIDKNTLAVADEVSFNLLNGDVNVKMFDKNKKIQISKN